MEEIINEFEEYCGNLAISGDSPSKETIKEFFDRYAESFRLQNHNATSLFCNFCGSDNLEDCGGDEYTCNDCGHFPIFIIEN